MKNIIIIITIFEFLFKDFEINIKSLLIISNKTINQI